MIKAIIRIFAAIKCSLQEKNRQSRQFQQKLREVYNESLIEVKLMQQLQYIVDEMINDPTIETIRIRFAQSALPFVEDAFAHTPLRVTECAEETEFIISCDEELL